LGPQLASTPLSSFTFDPNDLHRLRRLMFVLRGATLEPTAGGRRSRRAGEGTDFLDFRPYTPGDDFRKLDWNLYGRLRQLFVRLNEAPRQLAVTLLVDSSRSMLFGAPVTKLLQAQRIACGLGFVALQGGDRIHVAHFGDRPHAPLGPVAGRRALGALVRYLQHMPTGGQSNLLDAARQLHGRRGLVVVLSDFLSVAHHEEALRRLLAGRAQVLVVQVLDPLDRGIGPQGTVRLRDSESGRMVDVRIDAANLARFQQAFEGRRQGLEAFCRRHGQHYLLALTGDPYLALICAALRDKAVVR
jgi:uncharacterized protein (DUF58 family)